MGRLGLSIRIIILDYSYYYSGPERQESLIDFLGQFARTDNIPKLNDGDLERNSDTEPSSDNDSQ